MHRILGVNEQHFRRSIHSFLTGLPTSYAQVSHGFPTGFPQICTQDFQKQRPYPSRVYRSTGL
jgi:hypothetical protein